MRVYQDFPNRYSLQTHFISLTPGITSIEKRLVPDSKNFSSRFVIYNHKKTSQIYESYVVVVDPSKAS